MKLDAQNDWKEEEVRLHLQQNTQLGTDLHWVVRSTAFWQAYDSLLALLKDLIEKRLEEEVKR